MTTRAKLTSHIAHLLEKHNQIEDQIMELERSGRYSDEQLHQLKKQKLAIKDEVELTKRQRDSLEA